MRRATTGRTGWFYTQVIHALRVTDETLSVENTSMDKARTKLDAGASCPDMTRSLGVVPTVGTLRGTPSCLRAWYLWV